jgi:hypothetical protein
MQVPLQSCWPETLQPQVPLVQVEPPAQAVQLVPQWAESVFELQLPSEHIVVPEGHDDEHCPSLQTCPLAHLFPQLPQSLVLDAMHEPLHDRRPPAQTQEPDVQVLPLPQTFPQVPQFWLSLCTLVQEPLHSIWLELQEGPVPPLPEPLVPPVPLAVPGFAHPEARRAAPNSATQAKKVLVRESILNSLWGAERTKRRPVPGEAEALYTPGAASGKANLGSDRTLGAKCLASPNPTR